jgi:hypothetical protein
MKFFVCFLTVFVCSPFAGVCFAQTGASIPNPWIDYAAHREIVNKIGTLREGRRLTEVGFLAKARETGTVLLDARSGPMFKRLHIAGAVNLSLPDFTADELARIIPDKGTPVLIYCNNNFLGSPVAMASKSPAASLNISTYVVLATYGYTNVYELGPLLDVKKTVLPLAGTEAASHARKAVQ